MLYSVVLVSAEQRSERIYTHTCMYISSLLSLPPTSPVPSSRSSLSFPPAIYFTHGGASMPMLLSQVIPPSFPRCITGHGVEFSLIYTRSLLVICLTL